MSEKEDYRVILRALGMALIEIRGSDDIRTMKGMADCFHNVPAMIAVNSPAVEIIRKILEIADRYGKKDYMKRFIEHEAKTYSLPLILKDD